jgi:5-methylcytosine-specific restriction endonuclease McrA
VCGGRAGKSWQADHVIPHRLGGTSDVSNLLPICPACNVLKRSHEPAVLRLILQLGMYARSEIRRDTALGRGLLDALMGRNKSNRRRRGSTQR